MKKTFTFLLSFLALFGMQQVKAANATITISDFAYAPNQVTINQGESVTWVWNSGTHPTTSDSSPAVWSTFTLDNSNTSFTQIFNTPGTYTFHCDFHSSMTGTIEVLSISGVKKDHLSALLLQAYPNPAKDKITVSVSQDRKENQTLKFMNLAGQEVKTVALEALKVQAGNTIEVQLNELAAGIYICTLHQQDKVIARQRIVVEK